MASISLSVNTQDIEPFKNYLIQMTTHTDYIAKKAVKTVMEQRVLETHREFMEKLDKG